MKFLFRQSMLNGPSSSDTVSNESFVYPNSLSSFRCSHSSPRGFNYQIKSRIAALLFACCPNTIIGLVISIYIFALDCHCSQKSGLHIGEKVPKIEPSFTDTNASSAIIFVIFRSFLRTTLNHIAPSEPQWMSPRKSALGIPEASTRIGTSGQEISARYNCFIAAVAAAAPKCSFNWIGRFAAEYSKFPKFLADQISECRHKASYIINLNGEQWCL